jgi:NAD(P)-dependent dehydrogenase (short-subunit alcohol dehydrogenase family)
MATAVLTGASRGLGLSLARGLLGAGWSLVIDARGERELEEAAAGLRRTTSAGDRLRIVAGDVADAGHRARLIDESARLGGLDLVVNNASSLGPSPLPRLEAYPLGELERVYEVNVVAPLAVVQLALPLLRASADPRILNVTSDASVEAYEGWGGYGSSKAALDHLGAVLAAEEPGVRVWSVDPGDMRTRMHQDAFPGEDISDRPHPDEVVPALLSLIHGGRPSGRYRAAELLPGAGGEAA